MILDHSYPRETKKMIENNIPLVIAGGTVEYHGLRQKGNNGIFRGNAWRTMVWQ